MLSLQKISPQLSAKYAYDSRRAPQRGKDCRANYALRVNFLIESIWPNLLFAFCNAWNDFLLYSLLELDVRLYLEQGEVGRSVYLVRFILFNSIAFAFPCH
jgi:hypothetical protein